jgi:dTDP-4-dehydrorhamnose 3,5-epimerase
MVFNKTDLPNVLLIDCEPAKDNRGYFGRTFCAREFANRQLCFDFVQTNLSYNQKKGTLRGMHFQIPPFEEVKLVSCIRGKIYDVVVDLRPDSPTRYRWVGISLNANTLQLLYIPKGFAHGFQTLSDDSLILYQISDYYHPECSTGFRYDDPLCGIDWPIDNPVISAHDLSLAFLTEACKADDLEKEICKN